MLRIALRMRAPMRQPVFARRRSRFLTIAVIGYLRTDQARD
jgi:hypothetical protein